jgi:hypothetical protein
MDQGPSRPEAACARFYLSRVLAVITASDFYRLAILRHVRGPEDARVRSASNRDAHPARSTVALVVAIMVLLRPQELEDQ